MYNLSDQLRAVIRLSGERQSSIASGAGIQASTLCRFVRGQGGLSSAVIDRLCRYLGIVVVGSSEWERRDRVYQAWRAGTLTLRRSGASLRGTSGKGGGV